MNSRRFLIYAVVYTAAVALVVYSLFPNDATVGALGYSFTLPVAIWVAIVVGILGLFALAHMVYYSFLVYNLKEQLKKMDKFIKIWLNLYFWQTHLARNFIQIILILLQA